MKAASKVTTDLLKAMAVPAEVIAAYRAAVRIYGERPWVTGIAVGRKTKKGRLQQSPRWVVAIHVTRKLPKSRVVKGNLIPDEIKGVPTDVLLGNYRRTAKTVPVTTATLHPGVAIATEKGSGGTLGGIVRGTDGSRYLLTAGHLLQDGGGKKGTSVVHPPSTPATPGDRAATVSAIHKTRDAGAAMLEAGVAADNNALSGTRITKPVLPQVDMMVEMFGAGSAGVKRGKVTQVGSTSQNGTFPVVFIRGTGTGAAARKGDSGTIWYDQASAAAIGLHVEVSGGGDAVATVAVNVLADLGKMLKTTLSWT